jgi:hypothetical protein
MHNRIPRIIPIFLHLLWPKPGDSFLFERVISHQILAKFSENLRSFGLKVTYCTMLIVQRRWSSPAYSVSIGLRIADIFLASNLDSNKCLSVYYKLSTETDIHDLQLR